VRSFFTPFALARLLVTHPYISEAIGHASFSEVSDESGQRTIGHMESTNQRITLWMALASGISVANLYYSQPLLVQMGRTFGVGHTVGYIPTFTLVGLVIGMLLLAPLGDMFERRRLITVVCVCASLATGAVAVAPNFTWLAIASLLVGTTSIVQHLILPFAAQIAPYRERGKTVGIVLSGMMIGALLARTVSGFVGAELGWRIMYCIAATLMLGIAVIVNSVFPERSPSEAISYRELLRSLITIAREQPLLRELAPDALAPAALLGHVLPALVEIVGVAQQTLDAFLEKPLLLGQIKIHFSLLSQNRMKPVGWVERLRNPSHRLGPVDDGYRFAQPILRTVSPLRSG